MFGGGGHGSALNADTEIHHNMNMASLFQKKKKKKMEVQKAVERNH